MNRVAELILGLIAGVLGIISGFLSYGILGITIILPFIAVYKSSGTILIGLSVLGIIGAFLARSNSVVGGILMLIAAIVGIISAMFIYMIPAILFFIAGLMCLFRKPNNTKY